MKFSEFIAKVNGVCKDAKIGKPTFKLDAEKNMYIAYCGGVRITGNPLSHKLTVKWGSGHMAQAAM